MSSTDENEGLEYYFENGFMVFTETYHLKRGYCCNNECRHCPYKKRLLPEEKSEKDLEIE